MVDVALGDKGWSLTAFVFVDSDTSKLEISSASLKIQSRSSQQNRPATCTVICVDALTMISPGECKIVAAQPFEQAGGYGPSTVPFFAQRVQLDHRYLECVQCKPNYSRKVV